MNKFIAIVAILLLSSPAFAQKKSCEDLKAEIEAKIKANGVQVFTLEIVASDSATEGKIVGTCDGGTKKIVYKKN